MSYYYDDTHKLISTFESRIHIDWLTLSFSVSDVITSDDLTELEDDVKSFFFLNDVDDAKNVNQRINVQYEGYTGYFDNHVILAENHNEFGDLVGFMLDMSGTGLKSLEYHLQDKIVDITHNDHLHVYDLITQFLQDYNGVYRVTRIDLADDLFDAPVELTPTYIYYWVKYCDGFRGRARYVDYEHSGQMGAYNHLIEPVEARDVIEYLSDSESEGTTTYIGKCPNRIRIYNKKAEQAMKDNPIQDNYCNWIRWELELRKDYAMKFIEYWLGKCHENIVMAYYGWLGQRFQFINNDGLQKRRDRYEITDWYKAFIDYTNGYPKLPTLINPQPKSTMYRKLHWISNGGAFNAINEMKDALHEVLSEKYGYLGDDKVDQIINNELHTLLQEMQRTGKVITDRDELERIIRVNDYVKEYRNQLHHDNMPDKPINNNTKATDLSDNINPFI